MITTHICCLFIAVGSAAVLTPDISTADDTLPQSRVAVATVFSKPIYADELDVDPSRKPPSGLTDEQLSQWRIYQRDSRLSHLIWAPLVDQYCLDHPCEPTDEEITAFNQSDERSKQQRVEGWRNRKTALTKALQSPDLTDARRKEATEQLKQLDSLLATEEHMYDGMTPEQRAAVEASRPAREREIARVFIRNWKFNKALYQQYGGRVIFQQAGMEPLDAYRAWLKEHESRGDFAINDATLRDQFWSYFLSEAHNFVPIEEFRKESGLVDPWEKPWWLLPQKENTN